MNVDVRIKRNDGDASVVVTLFGSVAKAFGKAVTVKRVGDIIELGIPQQGEQAYKIHGRTFVVSSFESSIFDGFEGFYQLTDNMIAPDNRIEQDAEETEALEEVIDTIDDVNSSSQKDEKGSDEDEEETEAERRDCDDLKEFRIDTNLANRFTITGNILHLLYETEIERENLERIKEIRDAIYIYDSLTDSDLDKNGILQYLTKIVEVDDIDNTPNASYTLFNLCEKTIHTITGAIIGDGEPEIENVKKAGKLLKARRILFEDIDERDMEEFWDRMNYAFRD